MEMLENTEVSGSVVANRLQKCVALSTIEAGLIAAVEACKELIWMKKFLGELGCSQERYCFIATVKVLFILAKVLHFMVDLNTLM